MVEFEFTIVLPTMNSRKSSISGPSPSDPIEFSTKERWHKEQADSPAIPPGIPVKTVGPLE
jgi:hypothetical protein